MIVNMSTNLKNIFLRIEPDFSSKTSKKNFWKLRREIICNEGTNFLLILSKDFTLHEFLASKREKMTLRLSPKNV